MNISLPDLNKMGGRMHSIKLRIVPKLLINSADLETGEVVISKDPQARETLIAQALSSQDYEYKGRLYEKLAKLNINMDPNSDLNGDEKNAIMDFVSKYSIPYFSPIEVMSCDRADPDVSTEGKGDEISWLFFPYLSKPEDPTNLSYFYSFRNMYRDFLSTLEIIKSGNYKDLEYLVGVINNSVKDNYPQLSFYRLTELGQYGLKWESKTSIASCCLELLGLILARSKVKNCKYCGDQFESSKNNVVCCPKCRNKVVYRKQYDEKNKERVRLKAKERMARLRKKAVVV